MANKLFQPLVNKLHSNKLNPFWVNKHYINYNFNNIEQLGDGILNGDRRALSRGITLIESTNVNHFKKGEELLSYLHSKNNINNSTKTFRIGITGAPGAGKSTFLNELGLRICRNDSKICILPVDPSSYISGGSILGDQTRMLSLFQNENSFIRPSPNKLNLGGITDTTFEVTKLCEYSAFNDYIFIETVGVGQNEIEIKYLCDLFILIITPTSGDHLQGLKKGIMEMADIIIVNKCDGEYIKYAKNTKSEFESSVKFIKSKNNDWKTKVLLCSSIDNNSPYNVGNVLNQINEYKNIIINNGIYHENKKSQSIYAMYQYLWRNLKYSVENVKMECNDIESNVSNDILSPRKGSQLVLQKLFNNYANIESQKKY